MSELGKFLKKAREKRKLSQGEVASRLGLEAAQSVSNIERGMSPLPASHVKKFAKILEVRPQVLAAIFVREAGRDYFRAAGLL